MARAISGGAYSHHERVPWWTVLRHGWLRMDPILLLTVVLAPSLAVFAAGCVLAIYRRTRGPRPIGIKPERSTRWSSSLDL